MVGLLTTEPIGASLLDGISSQPRPMWVLKGYGLRLRSKVGATGCKADMADEMSSVFVYFLAVG